MKEKNNAFLLILRMYVEGTHVCGQVPTLELVLLFHLYMGSEERIQAVRHKQQVRVSVPAWHVLSLLSVVSFSPSAQFLPILI